MTWLRTLLLVLAATTAAVSAVMLAWTGDGIAPLFPDFFRAAENAMSWAAAPVERVFRPVLAIVAPWWGGNADIAPHGKHIAILTWVLMAATLHATHRWPDAWIVTIVWSCVCAIAAGAVAGSVALGDQVVSGAIAGAFAAAGLAVWAWQLAIDGPYRDSWDGTFQIWVLLVFGGIFFVLFETGAITPPPPMAPKPEPPLHFENVAAMWLYTTVLWLAFGLVDQESAGDDGLFAQWRRSRFTSAGATLLGVAVLSALALGPALLAR